MLQGVSYLTVAQVLAVHDQVIAETGGEPGVVSHKTLAAAVAVPKTTFYGTDIYAGLFDKAAALFEALVRNHPFVDGNQRTGMAAAALFLRGNGYQLTTAQAESVQLTRQVGAGSLDRKEIAAWLAARSRRLDD